MLNSESSLPVWAQPPIYRVILITCVVGSAYGLSVGRPMLQTGAPHFGYAEVLRFPFPLSTSLIQSLVTSTLILLGGCVFLLFRNDDYQWHSKSYALVPQPSSWVDDNSTGSEDGKEVSTRMRWWNGLHSVVLAAAIAGEMALANYVLCFAPLEIYVISRALVLPISILISKLLRSKHACSHSMGDILASLLLSLGIILAAYRFDVPRPSRAVWCTLYSAILGALWPLLVQRSSSYNGELDIRSSELSQVAKSRHVRRTAFTLWKNIWYTSVIGTTILLSAVYVSGEPHSMLRNFYVAEPVYSWIQLQMIVACLRFTFFCSTYLLIDATCATTATFIICFTYGSQISVLTFSDLLAAQQAGVVICVVAGAWYCWNHRPSSLVVLRRSEEFGYHLSLGRLRAFMLQRTVLVILTLVACVIGIKIGFYSGVKKQHFAPLTLAIPELDAYLGPRPSMNTTANLDLLVQKCRGSVVQLENMKDVRGCLDYLATQQDTYFDTHEKTRTARAENSDANLQQQRGRPACNGPITLYHVWWTGSPSWRTELFIKGYLSTQMLDCSRLWIWVNIDRHPDAMEHWLKHPNFSKFIPFVNDGDILLKKWQLPSRVPISPHIDPVDKARYFPNPGRRNSHGEILVADSIIRDASGQDYIQFYEPGDDTQLTFYTVASSDAARLVILHLHGGVYLDIDMLLLRDMRPLILPGRPFSERWGAHDDPTQYNNAVVALPANSSMSSYLLTGGTRMGLMYHFLILGRMMVKEGRNEVDPERGLLKLESAFFDPIWPALDSMSEGRCLVPCLKSYQDVFKARLSDDEWSAYDGKQGPRSNTGNNRTMENFFRGAWAYHIHNQWHATYEPGSWIDVVLRTHDRFFDGAATNAYGESWTGKPLSPYSVSTS